MKKKKNKKVYIFSCGSQFAEWWTRNCLKCKKYDEDVDKTCSLERELNEAYLSDGKVSEETARKIGYQAKYYFWDCKEKDVIC